MPKPNYNRYTKWNTTPITIIGEEPDGNGFWKYMTKSGHELFSKYNHKVSHNTPIEMLINYDTHYGKWRLVEIK